MKEAESLSSSFSAFFHSLLPAAKCSHSITFFHLEQEIAAEGSTIGALLPPAGSSRFLFPHRGPAQALRSEELGSVCTRRTRNREDLALAGIFYTPVTSARPLSSTILDRLKPLTRAQVSS